jgi:hypothetical protein
MHSGQLWMWVSTNVSFRAIEPYHPVWYFRMNQLGHKAPCNYPMDSPLNAQRRAQFSPLQIHLIFCIPWSMKKRKYHKRINLYLTLRTFHVRPIFLNSICLMTVSFQVLTIVYQTDITRTMSDQPGYRSGNALHLYSVKFLVRISAVTPAILTKVFWWFLPVPWRTRSNSIPNRPRLHPSKSFAIHHSVLISHSLIQKASLSNLCLGKLHAR